jgi:hypothetical protein
MAWVAVRGDKLALYNLEHFEAITVFEAADRRGWWMVSAIQGGEPKAMLAEAPDRESAENILAHIRDEIGALDLGQE